MANPAITTEGQYSPEAKNDALVSSLRFDLLMAILGIIFVGGLYLDGWAHAHGMVDRTFFTPWHAVLYSAYFLNAIVLVATLFLNHARGYAWRRAMPAGYELSLLGVPLFALGGVGDVFWHILFGFEVGIEPLLSPTHLVLALSGIFIMSGPLRAALRRSNSASRSGWPSLFPMILSLTAVWSAFTFFTEFAHPFVNTFLVTDGLGNGQQSWGAAGILLQAGLLMGLILLALRRWRLPWGTLTVMFTLNVTLLSFLSDQYRLIPVALAAGVVADVLLWWLRPSTTRFNELRLFAFVVPVVLYLFYFLVLGLTEGIVWSIHLSLGSCILAGVVGFLLSYLMVGPQSSGERGGV